MPTLELETMRVELDGPLGRLRLNRPEALNAANWAIAAIHGYCLGGGLQVALACDLRIATTNAILSIPAVREGLVAALGPMRLARIIGAGPAKQLCFFGHQFTGEEGVALRIINEACAPDRLEERALAMAEELLAIPFTALKHTKRQIDRAFEQDTGTLLAEFLDAVEDCLRSPEHKAVMAAYREELARRGKVKEERP